MGAEAGDATDFRSLVEKKEKELVKICVQKEKELVELCEQQVQQLHLQVMDRDKNFAELSAKFCLLKEDFKYNLELLEGRDAELSQYEAKLSALEDSAKEAAKAVHESHQKLVNSEFQRSQERSRAEEKDKLYQCTLLDIREQMESLQLSKEQLLIMHKKAFKTASAELMSEVKKKQVDFEIHNKLMEAQALDKIRIHELQSQLKEKQTRAKCDNEKATLPTKNPLLVDGMKNQLLSAEATIERLERERDDVEKDNLEAEQELRSQLRDKDKAIKQLSVELRQIQSENDAKSKAESSEKLLQMKSQMEDLQKRVDIAEGRLNRYGERPADIAIYLAKVEKLEQELMSQENEMNKILESVEAYIRKAARLQDQKIQDLKTQISNRRYQHDVLRSKASSSPQVDVKAGKEEQQPLPAPAPVPDPLVESLIYNEKNENRFCLTTSRRGPGAEGAGAPSLTPPPVLFHLGKLPQSHSAGGGGGGGLATTSDNNSLGSSLPRASPLLSPTSSIFEEMHLPDLGQMRKGETQALTEEEDLKRDEKEKMVERARSKAEHMRALQKAAEDHHCEDRKVKKLSPHLHPGEDRELSESASTRSVKHHHRRIKNAHFEDIDYAVGSPWDGNDAHGDVVVQGDPTTLLENGGDRHNPSLKLLLVNVEQENRSLRESVDNLKVQNERFRFVIGAMRADMEAVQKATMERATTQSSSDCGGGKGGGGGGGGAIVRPEAPASSKTEEIKQLRDEAHLLAYDLQRIRQQRSEAAVAGAAMAALEQYQQQQQQNSVRASELPAPIPPQTAAAHHKTGEQSDQIGSVSNDEMLSATSASTKIAELERVQGVLRSQLQRAAADITRMTDERDRLMEISNSLRADLNRLLQQQRSSFRTMNPVYEDCDNSPPARARNPPRIIMGGNRSSGSSHGAGLKSGTSPPKIQHPSRAIGAAVAAPAPAPASVRSSKQANNRNSEVSRGTTIPVNSELEEGIHGAHGGEGGEGREGGGGGGGGWLHLEGKMKSLKERPDPVPDYVHKGIPSQRLKLHQSVKRREAQMAAQVAASRVKVRNYFIKDDDAWQ